MRGQPEIIQTSTVVQTLKLGLLEELADDSAEHALLRNLGDGDLSTAAITQWLTHCWEEVRSNPGLRYDYNPYEPFSLFVEMVASRLSGDCCAQRYRLMFPTLQQFEDSEETEIADLRLGRFLISGHNHDNFIDILGAIKKTAEGSEPGPRPILNPSTGMPLSEEELAVMNQDIRVFDACVDLELLRRLESNTKIKKHLTELQRLRDGLSRGDVAHSGEEYSAGAQGNEALVVFRDYLGCLTAYDRFIFMGLRRGMITLGSVWRVLLHPENYVGRDGVQTAATCIFLRGSDIQRIINHNRRQNTADDTSVQVRAGVHTIRSKVVQMEIGAGKAVLPDNELFLFINNMPARRLNLFAEQPCRCPRILNLLAQFSSRIEAVSCGKLARRAALLTEGALTSLMRQYVGYTEGDRQDFLVAINRESHEKIVQNPYVIRSVREALNAAAQIVVEDLEARAPHSRKTRILRALYDDFRLSELNLGLATDAFRHPPVLQFMFVMSQHKGANLPHSSPRSWRLFLSHLERNNMAHLALNGGGSSVNLERMSGRRDENGRKVSTSKEKVYASYGLFSKNDTAVVINLSPRNHNQDLCLEFMSLVRKSMGWQSIGSDKRVGLERFEREVVALSANNEQGIRDKLNNFISLAHAHRISSSVQQAPRSAQRCLSLLRQQKFSSLNDMVTDNQFQVRAA